MVYFVTYRTDSGERIEKFNTIDQYFQWLQEFWEKNGAQPNGLCVFKADCIFDIS